MSMWKSNTKVQKENKPGAWQWEWRRDEESIAVFYLTEMGRVVRTDLSNVK